MNKAAIRYSKYYFSWLLLIWPSILVYFYNPYYRSYLSHATKVTILALAVSYSLAAPFAYWLASRQQRQLAPSRAYEVVTALWRLGCWLRLYLNNFLKKTNYQMPAISRQDRTSILFMLVKLFFLPLMFNFMYANISGVHTGVNSFNTFGFSVNWQTFNSVIYPFLISVLLLIDTAYFSFGYAVESKYLGNRVLSVDPTFLGWFSALICYPPFNDTIGRYAPWYANDNVTFHSLIATNVLHLLVLVSFVIYVAATVALGAKASNLTNRGIVARWPYSLVRHPAYISKNLAWWLTLLPVVTPAAALSMAFWSFIYLTRSLTEERHLMMLDNGYQKYAELVRWRFIPGII